MPAPSPVYKYMPYSGKHVPWVHETLTANRIYFPSSRDFNDPVDCRPTFIVSKQDTWLKKMVAKIMAGQPRSERRRELAKFRKADLWYKPSTIEKFTTGFLQEVQYPIGVLSLSAAGDSVLLWSYYSEGHRGICFGFDGADPFFSRAQAVHYVEKLSPVDLASNNDDENVRMCLLTKTEKWKHESEWRILGHTDGSVGYHAFPQNSLLELRFGASFPREQRDALCVMARARFPKIQLIQMQIGPDGSVRPTPCA